MKLLTFLLDLLFPPKCVFCGRVLNKSGDDLCDKCTEMLPYTTNYGQQKGEIFDFCISPLYYKEVVRKSILRYKFRGATQYVEIYGEILADCISACPDVEYDLISWVPLNEKRKRKRGYDQAMLLALATALRLDDVAIETLKKPNNVRAQSELGDRAERSANISGAFSVVDREIIRDKRILLIDDIVTTCSTLDECARVLLSGGAKNVLCAALARGE
ncbi:MAG: double zinc ribbon domain-containing protein [Oscillospiraceae bacterium]|nr:double zinc ribbon domain-containing protein [Oscillospiraceae bacterium]